jgi:hypothetical protein
MYFAYDPGSLACFTILANGALSDENDVMPIALSVMPSATRHADTAKAEVSTASPVPSPAARQTAPHPHMATTSPDGKYDHTLLAM